MKIASHGKGFCATVGEILEELTITETPLEALLSGLSFAPVTVFLIAIWIQDQIWNLSP